MCSFSLLLGYTFTLLNEKRNRKVDFNMDKPFLLELKNISKNYGEATVLKNVNLQIKPGEVHALVGENGAGKSTITNIMFGMPVIQSTGGFNGEIYWNGEKTVIDSPQKAMELGIGMVHQEFMSIPGFTVAENIKLNREPLKETSVSKILGKKFATLDYEKMEKDSRAALDQIGVSLSEKSLVRGLPVGYMQFVEISREIDKENIKLIVFDEPTAVLTESEAQVLLDAIRRISARGTAVIFITHRLEEVMSVAENITILRDGEVIKHLKASDTNAEELAELMVGREITSVYEKTKAPADENSEIAIELEHFAVAMPGERTKDINLKIRKGEIFGIAGLAGQGKVSIPNGIMGLYPTTGTLKINGTVVETPSPQKSFDLGCAFVSEDRRGSGLLLDSSIETNIMISSMCAQKKFLKKFGLFSQINKKETRKRAEDMIKLLDIRCTGPEQHTRRLSGGNQQKVCIARALTLDPQILMVSEPTRGIDIGAKMMILSYLVELNQKQDTTVVVVSSELAELRSVCDRIAIVADGKVQGVLKATDPDSQFGLLMSGYDSTKEKKGDNK